MDTMHSELDTAFDRRVIRRLMSLCVANDFDAIDADKFREAVISRMSVSPQTAHDILQAFNDMSNTVQFNILQEVGRKKDNKVEPLINVVDDQPLLMHYLPELEIKKQLKYCKNPVRVKASSKQLNHIKYKKGKRRR